MQQFPFSSSLVLSSALLSALLIAPNFATESAAVPNSGSAASGGAKTKFTVAVIPKGTTHEFWKTVHAGAVKAGQEEGAEIIWQGPAKEDDRKGQIDVVQNFTSRGVDAIVLAPLDETALARPVEAAAKRDVKVVIIDSDLKSKAFSSFVATDNYAAGKLAAKEMANVLGGAGKVMVMRYLEGSASNSNRENGFLDGLKEYAPKVEVISSNQYAGVTAESALKTAQNLLNKFSEIDGIFTPNAPTTFGMLRALQIAGRSARSDRMSKENAKGKAKLIGFDATEPLLNAMKAGEVQGLVVQDPFRMGYLGVKTVLAAKRGEKVEGRVDTGARLITAASLADPAVQELVHPDLKKWLGE